MEKLNTRTASLENLADFLEKSKGSDGKELGIRGYVERVNGEDVVFLFRRSQKGNLMENLVDRFWNWFDRDAQRERAREGLNSILSSSNLGKDVLQDLRQKNGKRRSLKPSEVLRAIPKKEQVRHPPKEATKVLSEGKKFAGLDQDGKNWLRADGQKYLGKHIEDFREYVGAPACDVGTAAEFAALASLVFKGSGGHALPMALNPVRIMQFAELWRKARAEKPETTIPETIMALIDALVEKLSEPAKRPDEKVFLSKVQNKLKTRDMEKENVNFYLQHGCRMYADGLSSEERIRFCGIKEVQPWERFLAFIKKIGAVEETIESGRTSMQKATGEDYGDVLNLAASVLDTKEKSLNKKKPSMNEEVFYAVADLVVIEWQLQVVESVHSILRPVSSVGFNEVQPEKPASAASPEASK